MGYFETSRAVIGMIIASIVIVRVVRLVNGCSFRSLMAFDRWERIAYQGAFLGLSVFLAVEHGGILLWLLLGALLAIAAVGFAFRPAQSKPVIPPARTDGTSEAS